MLITKCMRLRTYSVLYSSLPNVVLPGKKRQNTAILTTFWNLATHACTNPLSSIWATFGTRVWTVVHAYTANFIWIGVLCSTWGRNTPNLAVFVNFSILRWCYLAAQRQVWTRLHKHKLSNAIEIVLEFEWLNCVLAFIIFTVQKRNEQNVKLPS